jgi:phosphoglucosamine mutase
MLQNAVAAGLLSSGVDVLDVDVMTTPGVAWAVRRLGAIAGLVISASHNPVEQNGLKFFGADGMKLKESIEEEIEQLAEPPVDGRGSFTVAKKPGRVMDSRNMHERYLEALSNEQSDLRLDNLTLVVDCANGAASKFAPDLFSRLGAQVAAVNASPSGMNINVEAGSEFVRQKPEKIGSLVKSYSANFGIAFDGDADRVIFVDDQGGVVDGDHMLGMLAKYFDGRRLLLGKTVVTTTMRNEGLKNFLDAANLKIAETSVGDKYIVEKLASLRNDMTPPKMIGLGGEQSGHIVMLNPDFTTGDGIRTALFVIKAYLESGSHSLAELAGLVGKTPQIIASAEVGAGPRLEKQALAALENETLAANPGLVRINLRYSGTEPKFRAMLESSATPDEEGLAVIAQKICRQMQQVAGLADAPIEIQNCSRGGLLKVE